jgi:hypothetical protein
MSIEKIERVREVMSWLDGWDDNRSAASFKGFQSVTLGDIRALLDELSRLREALRPFAAAANCHSNDKEFMPDAMLIWRGGECTIRLGDLRRARALSEQEGQE